MRILFILYLYFFDAIMNIFTKKSGEKNEEK